jgi:hypothetical protein
VDGDGGRQERQEDVLHVDLQQRGC